MRRGAVGFGLVLLGAMGLVAVLVAWVAVGAYGTVSPLWAAILPGLLLASGLALLRKEAQVPSEDLSAPLGPPEVEVSLIPKGPVSACMRCGARGMQPAPMGADVLFNQWRCPRCGWRGQPLLFDTGEEWANFVKDRRSNPEREPES